MAETNVAGGVVTLSARFSEREVGSLRKAAELRKWSLSQLIHAGACEKALNIVNAGGESSSAIRVFCGVIAKQLLSPGIQLLDPAYGEPLPDKAVEEFLYEHDVKTDCLNEGDQALLVNVLAALGAEFAPILKQELDRARQNRTYRADLHEKLVLPLDQAPLTPEVETASATEPVVAKKAGPKKLSKTKKP